MKNISLLNSAAAIAGLTVLAGALILVPDPLWSAVTIVAAIGFASSVGFVFFIPTILHHQRQNTDARQMATIGSLGVLSALLLLAMGASFLLALLGYQKPGIAMLVLGVGAFLVISLVLNVALRIVGDISSKWSHPSHHVDWQHQVNMLVSQATHQESVEKLLALGEKLRYSASDVPGGSPQDSGIEAAFSGMAAQLKTDPSADLTGIFGDLDSLLIQRDVNLRAARGKA